jgi:hypothetical protein
MFGGVPGTSTSQLSWRFQARNDSTSGARPSEWPSASDAQHVGSILLRRPAA